MIVQRTLDSVSGASTGTGVRFFSNRSADSDCCNEREQKVDVHNACQEDAAVGVRLYGVVDQCHKKRAVRGEAQPSYTLPQS